MKTFVSKLRRGKSDKNKAVIDHIICPDGKRRTFYQNGTMHDGNRRGYVQVFDKPRGKQASVSGYAKAVGVGFKFFPFFDGANPPALPLQSRVQMNDGRIGTIHKVGWDYLTPRYSVVVEVEDGESLKPIEEN